MSKREKVETALKELIVLAKDLDEFKSYQLRNELCNTLGKYFNSADNRKFIIEQTNPIVRDRTSGANIVQLKPEDFRNAANKNVKPEVINEIVEKAESATVNPDKELANMNTRDLKKYFGDISLALEYLNGERTALGLQLIEFKDDLQWNDIKNFLKENIGERIKEEQLN